MQMGWIDYSEKDKKNALSIYEDVEKDRDELGLSCIYNPLINKFFPGVTSMLTRAKYYFLIPYAMIYMENMEYKSRKEYITAFEDLELQFSKQIYNASAVKKHTGIIGVTNINDKKNAKEWIKTHKPHERYWSSICRYKLLTYSGRFDKYIQYLCKKKVELPDNNSIKYWNIDDDVLPPSLISGAEKAANSDGTNESPEWMNNLTIELTPKEAECLKDHILKNTGGSVLAHVLTNNDKEFNVLANSKMTAFTECDNFSELSVNNFIPEGLKGYYEFAVAFSDFAKVLQTIYNLMINPEYPKTLRYWNEIDPITAANEFSEKSKQIDIYSNLKLYDKEFFENSIKYMQIFKKSDYEKDEKDEKIDVEELKKSKLGNHIKERAKTMHKSGDNKFYGVELDYRFQIAKRIINDIQNPGKENYT